VRTLSAREVRWSTAFGGVLVLRLLYPFFNSPLTHLWSDPQRHWDNGLHFLHPGVMGGGDPYMYQLWLFTLQKIAGDSSATILIGCGLLCAAMPYGWYRALRELMGRAPALRAAVVIGVWPPFVSIYGYFMSETLLLTLTGFAFALSLRALRKRTLGAFAAACALWLLASFTRIVALPIGALCLLCAFFLQPHKLRALLLGLALTAALVVPAGLHARLALGYFAPLGNLYLNEIYHAGSNMSIQIDCGPKGRYIFGSPSFYNQTFYPFSNWTTARAGTLAITIDTDKGRADWRRALQQISQQHWGWRWRVHDFIENLSYLLFGQSWPDNDRSTVMGALAVWWRWLFVPIVLVTAIAAVRGSYRGREWLLPACALMSLLLLAVQREGIMEGRYRKPLEPIFLVSLALAWQARARAVTPR
jgi:hypothetical protein